jgi:hypothetical protein
MSSYLHKFFVALTLWAFANVCQAYDHKGCLLGLDSTRQSSELDEALKSMFSTSLALLESGVMTDYDKVSHLNSSGQLASAALNSAQVITSLRQHGRFERPEAVDKLLKIEFSVVFLKFKTARNEFVKHTDSLKNPSLRGQASKVSQELEEILIKIRSCEN